MRLYEENKKLKHQLATSWSTAQSVVSAGEEKPKNKRPLPTAPGKGHAKQNDKQKLQKDKTKPITPIMQPEARPGVCTETCPSPASEVSSSDPGSDTEKDSSSYDFGSSSAETDPKAQDMNVQKTIQKPRVA